MEDRSWSDYTKPMNYMPTPAGGAMAVIGGLAGYLQSKAARKAEAERRDRAKNYLSSYTYNPYSQKYNPYQSNLYGGQESALASLISGQLNPAQQQQLQYQRQSGINDINRVSAARGMPAGGQAALTSQLGSNIAREAGNLSYGNINLGLSQALPYQEFRASQDEKKYAYGLAEWVRQQKAAQDKARLLAQLAS